MKTNIYKSNDRGHADHGWLNAHHSFSFANWYDPSKIHFGMLRVFNDDIVAPGQGFGMHPTGRSPYERRRRRLFDGGSR